MRNFAGALRIETEQFDQVRSIALTRNYALDTHLLILMDMKCSRKLNVLQGKFRDVQHGAYRFYSQSDVKRPGNDRLAEYPMVR